MALRSELNPYRAFAAACAVVLLCAVPLGARATETDKAQAKPTPPFAVIPAATTTAPAKATTAKSTTATTTAKSTTTAPTTASMADAKRAAAKRRQLPPVMTTANAANIKQAYPWSTGTKPGAPAAKTTASAPFNDVKTGNAVQSPGYAMTVTASRKTTAKPVMSTTTARPATAPATTSSASFKDRMARTTVTPPVMASGAKASNTTPMMKTAAPTNATPAAPKQAMAPAKPKSPPPGAKPDWTFRQVVATSSSSAKMAGGVSLATKPTANWTKDQPATATTTTTVKSPGTTTTAAKTTVAMTTSAATTKSTVSTKPGAAFKGVQAGSTPMASATVTKNPASMENPKAARPGAPLTTSVQSLGARFMEQREQYVYNSLNRRDPFASLVSGSFEGEVGTPLLDVSSMKLVGIVWGASDKFALVEDGHGHGFVLRVGDPVLNGYIAGLTKQELIVKQSSYGDTQTVTIQLQRKEGASNAQ